MNKNKLIEELNKILNEGKDRLLEFTIPSKKLESRIEDITESVFLHIYKVLAFSDKYPENVEHWCSEISVMLKPVCKMTVKSTNKPFTTEKICKIMFTVYSTVEEFTMGDQLVPKYGYSDVPDSVVYDKFKSILPKLIDYIKSVKVDERAKLETISKIIRGI